MAQEYLAIGEAPDQVRNCYQQRSRWCKGHFQIFFNKNHCPLFQSKLSVSQVPDYSAMSSTLSIVCFGSSVFVHFRWDCEPTQGRV